MRESISHWSFEWIDIQTLQALMRAGVVDGERMSERALEIITTHPGLPISLGYKIAHDLEKAMEESHCSAISLIATDASGLVLASSVASAYRPPAGYNWPLNFRLLEPQSRFLEVHPCLYWIVSLFAATRDDLDAVAVNVRSRISSLDSVYGYSLFTAFNPAVCEKSGTCERIIGGYQLETLTDLCEQIAEYFRPRLLHAS